MVLRVIGFPRKIDCVVGILAKCICDLKFFEVLEFAALFVKVVAMQTILYQSAVTRDADVDQSKISRSL